MANPEHVAKLKEGVEAWNEWRDDNKEIRPDLSFLNLQKEGLSSKHLSYGRFQEVDFSSVKFYNSEEIYEAHFYKAKLNGAKFADVSFRDSDFSGAECIDVSIFEKVSFSNCEFDHINFVGGEFRDVFFGNSRFVRATFAGTGFNESSFGKGCDLTKVTVSASFYRAGISYSDMSEADLSGSSFSLGDFNNVNLNNAKLEGLYLDGVAFRECDLTGANLKQVNFRGDWGEYLGSKNPSEGFPFPRSNLRDVVFEGAKFGSSASDVVKPANIDFTGADLRGIDFKGQDVVDLASAKLAETNLSDVELSGLDLTGADLSGSKLENTNLTDSTLFDVNLSGADVRHSIGLVLDANYIRDTRFASYASDPWSTLRRNYTGANLILNLLALTIFAIPFIVKTTLWTGVNRVQDALAESTAALESASLRLQKQENPIATEIGAIGESLVELQSCLALECREWSILQLLVGADRGSYYWLFPTALVIYTLLRATLTWNVGPLRDEEERSNYAPALQAYRWLTYLDEVVQLLAFVGLVFFLDHTLPQLLRILFSRVSVPID